MPFHTLRYWTSGTGGRPRLRELPFLRATADELPIEVRSVVLTSDLQGREYLSRKLHGTERLLGEAVADELAKLRGAGIIPDISTLLSCGDLYDYPDCRKVGGSGNVTAAFKALSTIARQVVGVLGNHDHVDPNEYLPSNVPLLDADLLMVSGFRVGGVSGVIGDPKRHNRRSEEAFLAAMEHVTRQSPDILLLHQGTEDVGLNQLGVPAIALSLETGFAGMTVFGHTRWSEHFLINLGDGQAVNVDGRVIIVT
ncbi:metallophosphoesterase family protein [Marinobacter orientalis]|uniref:Calcineurin-like phosphoesterase domain-containing protein n=1 Tax=Marinobacter orientalis TaxID=1928859 RepID=A0A7Y0RC33_9GAMM|nr:metallophosphoesterase [Marinobacter orientalis]NMT63482.1 hypothetical protein [Marinobacter orientalis]TGX48543.1 hypothetical protein DIT72_14210 [Marinobacter orientalis]